MKYYINTFNIKMISDQCKLISCERGIKFFSRAHAHTQLNCLFLNFQEPCLEEKKERKIMQLVMIDILIEMERLFFFF